MTFSDERLPRAIEAGRSRPGPTTPSWRSSAGAPPVPAVVLGALLGAAACEDEAVFDLFPSPPSTPQPPSGSGGSDPQTPVDAGQAPISPTLPQPVHRYSFSGTGTRAMDSIGDAHGEILGGAVLDGSGQLRIDGVDDYVDLPNGIVSGLTSATFMAWATWDGSDCWHRVFDFGSTSNGEDVLGIAVTEIFLTFEPCPRSGGPLVRMHLFGTETSTGVATPIAPVDVQYFAVVFDDPAQTMTIHVNASESSSVPVPGQLADIHDENNWLGRSAWPQDTHLIGSFEEFRIYDVTLTAEEIALAFTMGPDAVQ